MYSFTILTFLLVGCLASVPILPTGPFRSKMNDSPIIVLVPGAFHLRASMDVLTGQLVKADC